MCQPTLTKTIDYNLLIKDTYFVAKVLIDPVMIIMKARNSWYGDQEAIV